MIELLGNIFGAIFNHKLAPVLGGIAVIYLGHLLYRCWFTKDRKAQRISEAANELRNVFTRITAVINQNYGFTCDQIVNDILKGTYPDQLNTYEALIHLLKGERKRSLSKAWQKYIDPDNSGSSEPFLTYCGPPFHGGEPYDSKYILDAIEHLISNANERIT